MKICIGLFLCFVIGGACRYFGLPVPAPPALMGALLIVSMSCGYILVDHYLTRRLATTRNYCAGSAGGGKGKSKTDGSEGGNIHG